MIKKINKTKTNYNLYNKCLKCKVYIPKKRFNKHKNSNKCKEYQKTIDVKKSLKTLNRIRI